jgi:7-cyano-7-deazaguanine reductase
VKYGEKEIEEFDVDKDLEVWPNKHKKDYLIKIELPEFMCMCPRSGYPDFATIYIDYTPDESVVELKALKLYINSFSKRYISHEDSANEIYDTFIRVLKPKYLKIVADFNPRGNVHTTIELDSKVIDAKS